MASEPFATFTEAFATLKVWGSAFEGPFRDCTKGFRDGLAVKPCRLKLIKLKLAGEVSRLAAKLWNAIRAWRESLQVSRGTGKQWSIAKRSADQGRRL